MSEPANYVKFSYKEYLTYFLKIHFPADYLYLMDCRKYITDLITKLSLAVVS